MKTAEELFEKLNPQDGKCPEWAKIFAIELAKLHVEAALKEAAEKATMKLEYPDDYAESNETGLTFASADEISRGGEYGAVIIEVDSIINAYPLSNIK